MHCSESEESALEHARSIIATAGGVGDAAAQQDDPDYEKAAVDDADNNDTAIAGAAILKPYTNTIRPKGGLPACGMCRSGRGVCRRPGAKGHLPLKGAEVLQLLPERRKRGVAAVGGSASQSVSSSCLPAKRRAPAVENKQQQQPAQPSVARSGRVRKAVSRWSEDPLSSVNLGGRQELLTAVVSGVVSSEKEFHEAKLAKQKEELAEFRAEQEKVRQEEAKARREAAARQEEIREMQEAAVAEVKKGFAAKSLAGFDTARLDYLRDIELLRRDLGLVVRPPQQEAFRAAGSDAGVSDAGISDKLSTESDWLQDMQRKCRQQAGVILMQQQQRLREQELAAARVAARLALGDPNDDESLRQRSRRVHPTIKKTR